MFLQLFTAPSVYPLWGVLVFVLGLMLGSFFNVCIYRSAVGMSVGRPKRSLCFRCGSPVRWHDNLPVISWFILGGRCRDCGARYGLRYAFVELLTGVIFLAIFLMINPAGDQPFQVATLWYFAFAGLLIVGTFTDFDHWIIPDGVTIGGGIASIVAALFIGLIDSTPRINEFGPFPVVRVFGDQDGFSLFIHLLRGASASGIEPGNFLWWEPLANALLGAAFGSGMLYGIGVVAKVMFGKEGMGLGDVKLFAMIGGTLGISGSLFTLVAACFLGVIAGGVMKVRSMVARDQEYQVDEYAGEVRSSLQVDDEEADAPDDCPEESLVVQLEEVKKTLPRPRQVHHLPFGPWISLGALLVLLFQPQIQAWLSRGMF